MSSLQKMTLLIRVREEGKKRSRRYEIEGTTNGVGMVDRIKPDNHPPYVYYLRGGDRDCGSPASVEDTAILVNFCGYFFTNEQINMIDGYSEIVDYWF